MLFNSIDFVFYIIPVFILYWLLLKHSLRAQNCFLLIASYLFYGFWDWRFLGLIGLSTIIDFLIGQRLSNVSSDKARKTLLGMSLVFNLGVLGVFKYYNFFIESFVDFVSIFGMEAESYSINIILPVGISFYTFQTLSYTIDVYRKKLEPTKDFIAFATFVTFFPQLVAGPIERASNLLPQFHKKRTFDLQNATDGMRQILWGLFKKVVIADNCALYVNMIFADYQEYSPSTLLLGGVFFAFQIYGDFSGYSDIAIGLSRLFGIRLMQNFAFPYFSRDIAEFWRRWHISLSTWFRDYVYIPLGGSRGGIWKTCINVVIIFVVSGFWHGANWTFIIWGAINAIFILPLIIFDINRNNLEVVAKGNLIPSLKDMISILFTFLITTIAWVFFRADTVNIAFEYLSKMISWSIFIPDIIEMKKLSNGADIVYLGFLISFLLIVEWLQRERPHGLHGLEDNFPKYVRWFFYYVVVIIIVWFGGSQQNFIYFQF